MPFFNALCGDASGRVIGLVGSRRRDTAADFVLAKTKLLEIWKPGDMLCSGGCPKGADAFAERIAKLKGFSIVIHYPKWRDEDGSFRKWAGFERNQTIVDSSDILIALPHPDRTGGTEDTIKKANKKHIQVILI